MKPIETVHLILFSRAPVAGKSKTRLAAALGAETARDFHACCLLDLIDTCERFRKEARAAANASSFQVRPHLFITPPGSEAAFAAQGVHWPPHFKVHAQTGADLGERMAAAFAAVFATDSATDSATALERGPQSACALLLGSDLPLLDGRHLRQAVQALETADVAFGATEDGGYYLVGMNQPRVGLFRLENWGGGEVLAQSLALARAQGLTAATIDALPDVDTAEDLAGVRAHPLFRELGDRRAVRFIAGLPHKTEAAGA